MPLAFRSLVAALVLAGTADAAAAAPAAGDLCLAAIAEVEAEVNDLPPGLLHAIALVESAHRPVGERRVVPWPWTINSPAGPFFLPDRERAVAKVEALRAAGHRNIDVGCMQVNLHHHPNAFASLEEAFDPDANVRYGAGFLHRLKGESPALFEAVGRYHSRTPERSLAYAKRVYSRWAALGGPADVVGVPRVTAARPTPGRIEPPPSLAGPPQPRRVWSRADVPQAGTPQALQRGAASDPRVLVRRIAP